MAKYLLSIFLFFISFTGFAADFVAGKDYEVLKINNGTAKKRNTPQVVEFFSLGCPWCYRLEPALHQWLDTHKEKIDFKKVPVIFNKDWESYAKAYYAAEALSLNSTMVPALFKAILQDKQSLSSDQAMIDFFIKQGVNPDIAKSAFTYSPSIDLSVKSGQTLMAEDHINAVPAFVINNQFKTDLQMAKTEERLFAILDYLIAQSKG